MSHLNLVSIIEKKRSSKVLTDDEIIYFVQSVVNSIRKNAYPMASKADPCQIGAMMMAFYLNGLNEEETVTLTHAMMSSGDVMTWKPEWRHLLVDKHSTGGVGDKVSLVLAPALAALGMKVPMISGRSLGLTGGTLDKLESIPGFRVELTTEEIVRQMDNVGCCIVGQTQDLVPADRVLYRCRNLTGTVCSRSLIIASIVSKKLAENVNALVYDVKCGSGAVCKTEEEAIAFGKKLVSATSKVPCSALITSMDSPLGMMVGNSLEVLEAINCLRDCGPPDLQELVEEIGGELLRLSSQCSSRLEGGRKIREVLKDGLALKKFCDMITSQGVSQDLARTLCFEDGASILPKANHVSIYKYHGPPGCINRIDAASLARVWKEEVDKKCVIDYGVGLVLLKHVGDEIKTGDSWLEVHHTAKELSKIQLDNIANSLSVGSEDESRRTRLNSVITKINGQIQVIQEICIL